MVRNDYFFHVKNMEAVLNRMVKEHPDNKMAFEYWWLFTWSIRISGISSMHTGNGEDTVQKQFRFHTGSHYVHNWTQQWGSHDQLTGICQPDTKLRMKLMQIFIQHTPMQERGWKEIFRYILVLLHFEEVEMSSWGEKNNTGSTWAGDYI